MSFITDVKAELLNRKIENECCRTSQKSGRGVFARECCMRTYLRGMFFMAASSNIRLGGSDLKVGTSSGYHLEFVFNSENSAADFAHVLAEFEMSPKKISRGGQFVVYLSDYESIKSLLGQMGASKTLLALENENVARQIRKEANRGANSVLANIQKHISAGAAAAIKIKAIDAAIGLAALPPALKEFAEIRLKHPDESLTELAKYFKVPITKSGINHRMRKLNEIYKKL